MLYSKLFGKTSKNITIDADSINAKLLSQAGFIQKQMSGVYNYLPLGLRVLKKIQQIIRQEMDAIGGQEILMPALSQEESWITTKRHHMDVLFHLQSQAGNSLVLNPTHEEVITPLVKKYTLSYKDLPVLLYQIQDKFRDEPRAKSGLLRGREFNMKDLYSFHQNVKDLDSFYQTVQKAYFKIFSRLDLSQTVLTFASGGSFSQYSHEFQTISSTGEDTIYYCSKCKIAVNKEIISQQSSCPQCGHSKLEPKKSIEIANIFKLGDKFSSAFDFFYQDKQGQKHPIIMGCYGIGPSRIMGAIAETSHDKNGLIWPASVAPYQVHLIGIDLFDTDTKKQTNDLYQKLLDANIEVLYDDRPQVSAGAKFTDADLIGLPLRLLVSQKSLKQGGAELKYRHSSQINILPFQEILAKIK
ncbi:hypothetical protein KJ909_00260 [Patescibacteria group bacterium]|nr:hypothetical protein [Patescibacteria group bacterium]